MTDLIRRLRRFFRRDDLPAYLLVSLGLLAVYTVAAGPKAAGLLGLRLAGSGSEALRWMLSNPVIEAATLGVGIMLALGGLGLLIQRAYGTQRP